MFGKDLTPAKIQMRLPGLVWGGSAMEAGLGRKRLVSLRHIQLAKVRTAGRMAVHSESTSILPWAEKPA